MTQYNNKNLKNLSAQLFLGTALTVISTQAAPLNIPESANGNNGHLVLQGNAANQFIQQLDSLPANAPDADKTAILQGDVQLNSHISPITGANVDKVILQGQTGANRTLDLNGHIGFTKAGGTIDLEISGDQKIIINNGAVAAANLTSGNVTFAGTAEHEVNAVDAFTNDKDLRITETARLVLNGATTVKNLTIDRADSNHGLTVSANTVVGEELLLTKGKITLGAARLETKNINVAKDQTIEFNHNNAILIASNGEINGTITAGVAQGTIVKENSADAKNNTLKISGPNDIKVGIINEGGVVHSTHKDGLGNATASFAFANTAHEKVLKITDANQTTKTGGLDLQGAGKITFETEKDIAFTGAMVNANGNIEFTKIGKGKLSIGDVTPATATAYAGKAIVNQGILEINAGATIAGLTVDIAKGATLQGSGAIGAVVNSGRVLAGNGTIGAAPVTLTVDRLEMKGADASIEVSVKKNLVDKLDVANELKNDGKGIVNFSLSDDTKVDEKTGLIVTEFLEVGSFQNADGTAVDTSTVAKLNDYLSKNVKGATANTDRLFDDVELSGSLKGGAGRLAISAKITDTTKTVAKEFTNAKAQSFLVDYLGEGVKDPKVSAETRKNLKVLVTDLRALSAKDKAAASKQIDQLSGAGTVAVLEGAAIAMTAVQDAVSLHVSTTLGGAAIASTPAALVGNAFNRAEGSEFAKLAESGVSAGNVDHTLENGVWGKAIGSFENRGTEGANYGNRTSAAGLVIGADYHVNAESVVGFGLSYTHQTTKVKENMGDANGKSFGATLYAATKWEDNIIDTALSVASNRYTFKRTVGSEHATAKPKGVDFGARVGIGRLIRTTSVDLTPYLGVSYRNASFNAYKETGLTVGNLDAQKTRLQTWTPRAGIAFSKAVTTANGSWTPSFTIGWEANIPTANKTMKLAFQNFGKYFTTNNVVKTRHMAVAGVGAAMDLSNGWNVNFAYQAKVGKKINTHEVALKVGTRF